jgi:hypothetical protein
LGADLRSFYLASADGKIYAASNVEAELEMKLQATELQAVGKHGKLAEAFAAVWIQAADRIAGQPAEYLTPGCYVAVMDDAPFLPQGLQQTQSRALGTVVFGILKDVP